jgi:hypothetical protein
VLLLPFADPCKGESCSGEETPRGKVPPPSRGSPALGVDGEAASGDDMEGCKGDGGTVDEGGLINMDLEPSTRRPPKGGSFVDVRGI